MIVPHTVRPGRSVYMMLDGDGELLACSHDQNDALVRGIARIGSLCGIGMPDATVDNPTREAWAAEMFENAWMCHANPPHMRHNEESTMGTKPLNEDMIIAAINKFQEAGRNAVAAGTFDQFEEEHHEVGFQLAAAAADFGSPQTWAAVNRALQDARGVEGGSSLADFCAKRGESEGQNPA